MKPSQFFSGRPASCLAAVQSCSAAVQGCSAAVQGCLPAIQGFSDDKGCLCPTLTLPCRQETSAPGRQLNISEQKLNNPWTADKQLAGSNFWRSSFTKNKFNQKW